MNIRKTALVVLSICMAIPSFAGDVVGHSAKVAGKAVTTASKDTAKATVKTVKFLF